MKYIRTKDGRLYELQDNGEWTKNGSLCLMTRHPNYSELQNCIIAQADTIEELCDEIVEIIDSKAQVVYADISFNDLAIAKIRDKNNAIVYGAIWTDKGLIYVAKMNNKGELEPL